MKGIIFLIISIAILELSAQATYKQFDSFPMYENTSFNFKITETSDFNLYSMLILSIVCDHKYVQNIKIFPGFVKELPVEIPGIYMRVLDHRTVDKELFVKLKLLRPSNLCSLRLLYRNSATKEERIEVYQKRLLRKYVLNDIKISLHLHWKLKLYEKTIDHRQDGLHVNYKGWIICEASGGFPDDSPEITGLNQLVHYKTGIIQPEKSKFVFRFKVDIRDFNKELVCRCGKDSIKKRLGVFHHATKVYTKPSLEDGWLTNNTKVLCLAHDGHPPPTMRWRVIKEPTLGAASRHLVIQNNVLYFKSNTPNLSKWVFRCHANNTIPDSIDKGAFKDFEVVYGVKPFKFIYIILIVLACFLFIAISFALFMKFLQVRRRKYSRSAGPRNFCQETHRHSDEEKRKGRAKSNYVMSYDVENGENQAEGDKDGKFKLKESEDNKENVSIVHNKFYNGAVNPPKKPFQPKRAFTNHQDYTHIDGPIDEV